MRKYFKSGRWQQTYKVIILIHIIVHLFGIGLSQAVGFVKGYMKQIGKNLKVISYVNLIFGKENIMITIKSGLHIILNISDKHEVH